MHENDQNIGEMNIGIYKTLGWTKGCVLYKMAMHMNWITLKICLALFVLLTRDDDGHTYANMAKLI